MIVVAPVNGRGDAASTNSTVAPVDTTERLRLPRILTKEMMARDAGHQSYRLTFGGHEFLVKYIDIRNSIGDVPIGIYAPQGDGSYRLSLYTESWAGQLKPTLDQDTGVLELREVAYPGLKGKVIVSCNLREIGTSHSRRNLPPLTITDFDTEGWTWSLAVGLPFFVVFVLTWRERLSQSVKWRAVACMILACAIAPTYKVWSFGNITRTIILPAALNTIEYPPQMTSRLLSICLLAVVLLAVWSVILRSRKRRSSPQMSAGAP